MKCMCSGYPAFLFAISLASLSPAIAGDQSSTEIGRQTVGLVAGGMFPVRLLAAQSSKLNGIAVYSSWHITLTDPIGDAWRSSTIAFGCGSGSLGVTEPTGAYGVGFTPEAVCMFTACGRFRPYVEGGGGASLDEFRRAYS